MANHMALTTELGPVGRIETGLRPPKTAGTEPLSTTAREPFTPDVGRQPVQQREVDQLPDACLLPVAQPSPAAHT